MEGHFRIQKDHIENTTKQIDVMGEKDTQGMTRSLEVIEVKENIKECEEMHESGKKKQTTHREDNTNANTQRQRRSGYRHGGQSSRKAEGYE